MRYRSESASTFFDSTYTANAKDDTAIEAAITTTSPFPTARLSTV